MKNDSTAWIATSLFKGELYLYDSCFNGTLSPSTELQIAQGPLIQCNGLLISVVALQQQDGAINCGLFSIAAAYHAAMNDNVDSLVFDEAKMRAHLIKCFEKGKLTVPLHKESDAQKTNTTNHCHYNILHVQETGLF